MLFFYSDFLYKAYVVVTHLNCINKLMQFKWVPTTYAFIKKVDKNYTGCNLRTMELLDSALIGACVVIRSNTVFAWEIIFYERTNAVFLENKKNILQAV